MKKSDIKQGQDYTYSTSEWSSRQRVRVVGEGKVVQGYGYSQRKVSGIKVQVLDRETGEPVLRQTNGPDSEPTPWFIVTTGRNIREEWAPYWENAKAQAFARRKAEVATRNAQNARAERLLDIIPAMRHAGLEDTSTVLYGSDKKIVGLLELHVEDIIECIEESDSPHLTRYRVTCPLSRNIEDFVLKGHGFILSEDDLMTVLR